MNTLYPVVFPNPTIDLVTKSSDSGDNARTVFGSNFPGMPPLQENPNAKKQKKKLDPHQRAESRMRGATSRSV